jgi:hypothetical protein
MSDTTGARDRAVGRAVSQYIFASGRGHTTTGDLHTHNQSDPPGGHGYVYYPGIELSAIDLREEMYAEIEWGGEVETARIVWVDEETGQLLTNNETAEALYIPSTGRIGIAWGAGADWADAEDLAEGIRMYCEDPDRFESGH